MGVNIPEILVANGSGIAMVLFLLFYRFRRYENHRLGERMFSSMLVCTLAALVTETVSFLIDGHVFPGGRFLQFFTNTVCTGMTATVGFLWCLYVDFRIHFNVRQQKIKAKVLGIPLVVVYALLLSNLFGSGVIFTVTPDNRYVRGSLNLVMYITMFGYYAESIAAVWHSKRKGVSLLFFPVHCFVAPCIVGTILQGLFYGLATGWMSTAIAFLCIYLEMQTSSAYVDTTSGLLNRQYLNHYLARAVRQKIRLQGIMMDVNDFKSINDCHGHAMGDRAIAELSRILSASLLENAIALRMAGDEFIVLLPGSQPQQLDEQIRRIYDGIEAFSRTGEVPFRLSVSMGTALLEGEDTEAFLSQMDRAMYEAKREYHQAHPKAPLFQDS